MSDVIEFRNLVVHGNPDTYSGDPYGKTFYTNDYPVNQSYPRATGGDPGLGPFNQYKLNGVVSGTVPFTYTSHDGDPIITIRIKLSELDVTTDRQAVVQIDNPVLNILPNGYQFEYPFNIYANLIQYDDLGSNPTAAQVLNMFNTATVRTSWLLISKPVTIGGYPNWEQGDYSVSTSVPMRIPMTTGKRIYFVLSNDSDCACAQRGKNVPVFVQDITQYYPSNPTGYIWRAQRGTDPNHPDSSKPIAWHLVRPFYVCRDVPNVGRCWCNCEDETPAFGPNGEDLR